MKTALPTFRAGRFTVELPASDNWAPLWFRPAGELRRWAAGLVINFNTLSVRTDVRESSVGSRTIAESMGEETFMMVSPYLHRVQLEKFLMSEDFERYLNALPTQDLRVSGAAYGHLRLEWSQKFDDALMDLKRLVQANLLSGPFDPEINFVTAPEMLFDTIDETIARLCDESGNYNADEVADAVMAMHGQTDDTGRILYIEFTRDELIGMMSIEFAGDDE